MKNKYYQNLEAAKLKQPKRIDLGLSQDIKKQTKKLEDAIKKGGFEVNKTLYKELTVKIKKLTSDTIKEINENDRKIFKEVMTLDPLMEKFIKAAKDLGVEEIMRQPVFAKANDMIKEADEAKRLNNKLEQRIKGDYKG